MTPLAIGAIGIVVLFIFIFSRMPIGIAMIVTGFLGFSYLTDMGAALRMLGTSPFSTTADYARSVLPLFILMGAFASYSGLSKDLYDTVSSWIGQLRGGLAMATVGACAGFAAISGSSLATAATIGSVSLPQMRRYKYDPKLATGSVAAGGTIGILIPPSISLVIYGLIAEQSIGRLFMAGIVPGILEAVFYIVAIFIITKLNPLLGPPGPKTNFIEKVVSLKNTWIVFLLFVIILGGLYFGVFTPTEAGGIGAFGVFAFAIARRKLHWQDFKKSIYDAARTTAMIFIILIGAIVLGYFLAVSRLPFELATIMTELTVNRYVILGLILFIYVLLGCIMDAPAMVLLTVPIFVPLISALGFDLIWFGIIVVRMSEIGLITPPVGMNVYVIKGVAGDISLGTIFRGIVPFLIADICHVVLLVAFPQIALFLPSLMK